MEINQHSLIWQLKPLTSSVFVDLDLEILRRDVCGLDKDGFTELKTKGHVTEGPHTQLSDLDTRTGQCLYREPSSSHHSCCCFTERSEQLLIHCVLSLPSPQNISPWRRFRCCSVLPGWPCSTFLIPTFFLPWVLSWLWLWDRRTRLLQRCYTLSRWASRAAIAPSGTWPTVSSKQS